MAYSRWGDSVWYTFWTVNSAPKDFSLPNKKLKNNQTFEICDIPGYYISYGDIKTKGLNTIISEVKEFYSKKHTITRYDIVDKIMIPVESEIDPKNPTDDQLLELIGYINQFISDVDEHFKLFTYFEYQWYYPIRNNIRWWFIDVEKKILKKLNIFLPF